MTLVSGAMVYFVIWWIVLFAVLPIGVKVPGQPTKGFATSAPEHPQMKKKCYITTAISAIIWVMIQIVMLNHWVRFT
jgi:predicted secreted protein